MENLLHNEPTNRTSDVQTVASHFTELSRIKTELDSFTGIVGSNPVGGTDVCHCDRVQKEIVKWVDPPFKESCQMYKEFIVSELILRWQKSKSIVC